MEGGDGIPSLQYGHLPIVGQPDAESIPVKSPGFQSGESVEPNVCVLKGRANGPASVPNVAFVVFDLVCLSRNQRLPVFGREYQVGEVGMEGLRHGWW